MEPVIRERPAMRPSLPESAVPQIVWLLAELLRHREGVDLQAFPDDLARLEAYARTLYESLQQQEQVVVLLEDALPEYRLHAVIHRVTIEALLDLRQQAPRYSSADPPERCPSCSHLLNGYWDCGFCGLEIENAYRQDQLRHSSAQPIDHLPLFYLLLPDPARQRVVILNGHHEVVWEISEAFEDCRPQSAVLLDAHQVLVADRDNHSVGEYGLFGDCHWSFEGRDAAHRLQQPVAATSYTRESGEVIVLIVDQGNHRVLAVDRNSEIVWQYGVQGEPGRDLGQLNKPASAQFTPTGTVLIADQGNARVIEVNPAYDLIVAETAADLHLIRPCHAQRLLNGNLLIVDPGSWRILEVDPEGLPVEECIYWREGYDERLRIEMPQTVIRLPNRHLILADAQQVLEIDLPSRELIWSARLASLHFPLQQDLRQTLHPDEDLIRNLRLGRVQTSFDLETSLRRVKMFADAPDDFYHRLKQMLISQQVLRGETILSEGQSGDTMYVLASGRVTVRRGGDALATLRTGEIFGEMALVLNMPRSADIVAAENCELLKLQRQSFETLLDAYPLIRERIKKLAEVRQHLRKRNAFAYGSDQLSNVKSLLEKQYQRVAEIKSSLQTSSHTSFIRAGKPEWRLRYDRIDRHTIHEAALQHQLCYEVHVELKPEAAGKPETAELIYARLESLGTVIKLWPDVEQVLKGNWEQQLVLSVLTGSGRDMVLDELHDLPEVSRVSVHGIWF